MTGNKEINWNKERLQFLVCENYTYLMNAATTPLRKEVFEAGYEYLRNQYAAGDISWEPLFARIDSSRGMIAEIAGGNAADYAFGANTNYNMNCLAGALKSQSGIGNIVTFKDEFPSTYVPWQYHGYKLNKVEIPQCGKNVIPNLLAAIDSNTKAVVVSAVQFASGLRLNTLRLGGELKKKQIPFIVNATQALGSVPISVDLAQVSALVCSSHKWLGAGCGVSIMYTSPEFRKNIRWPFAGFMSFNDLSFSGNIDTPREDTAFIELGTPNFHTLLALEESLKQALRLGVGNIGARILELTDYIVAKARADQIEVLSYRDEEPDINLSQNSGIIALKVEDPQHLEKELFKQNILVNERRGHLRISPHYYNNFQDIDLLFSTLSKLIR